MTDLWEVQEFTLCGWANNWDTDGKPSVFKSKADAEEELNWFLAECQDEVEAGNLEDVPDREDFRIVPL